MSPYVMFFISDFVSTCMFVCLSVSPFLSLFLSLSHVCPGGVEPQFWDIHHYEPGWEGLWGQAETTRQPEAAVPACGHVSPGQRANCGGYPLL